MCSSGPAGNNGEAVSHGRDQSSRGRQATWIRCDVTDRESVTNAVSTAVASTGRLDAVVHNATSGAWSSRPAESVDETLWEDHVSVSLRGAYYCAQEASKLNSVHAAGLW